MRKLLLMLILALTAVPAAADGIPKASAFRVVCDTLTARCNRHFQVKSAVSLEKIFLRNDALDLYFNRSLADYPWHEDDALWFLSELNKEAGDLLNGYTVGLCMASGCRLEELVTPRLSRDGKYRQYAYSIQSPELRPLVRRPQARRISKGLYGRHIVLWQSHGLYWNEEEQRWKWQRATLHRTVEDMYTQSYVLQGVIPMLENAGAYVMTPRERDIQTQEVICDNDDSFVREGPGRVRQCGTYTEQGSWQTASCPGFADLKQVYSITDNPFKTGTVRTAKCSVTPASVARWTPDIPERGEYAVYVSYASFKNSCREARYTVNHLGGATVFTVDQTRGGGTWIYLGTFEFAPGTDGWVELINRGGGNEVVSADAVRFGGGMGKVARGGCISGMPAFTEGSSYWMPWAGADSTLRQWEKDYTNDFATRGAWVQMMNREKKIRFDCSLAFHTDAGVTPNDSIVGTLAIYSLKGDKGRDFPDGSDRLTSRTYADFVQTQIVEDVRIGFEPKWTRRQLWDRSYSESRTTEVPAMLLELLSHQNFADMKYGLDPSFRFLVSRAVYKGILKYLAARYGCSYVVQPLPVHAMAAEFTENGEIRISWKPTMDMFEPTAKPKGYTLYTRIDGGAFDEGVPVLECETVMPIEKGHIYSFKVCAWNDGGSSFPSEVLSAGVPSLASGGAVLVVNNFDRVAAPAWIDTPDYAGFESRLDAGMPYVRDICYIGDNYEFRRSLKWESDDAPGFGGSYSDYAGYAVAGNTFDYPVVHGASLMRLGRPFCSMSSEAFCADTTLAGAYSCLDLICGAQLTTVCGSGTYNPRFQVFPAQLRSALRAWTRNGNPLFVSGSRIATDVWDKVYNYEADSLSVADTREFVQEVLGYRFASSYGTNTGMLDGMPFYDSENPLCYAVPHPDGIKPARAGAKIWMRYGGMDEPVWLWHGGSGVSAAVCYDAGTHRAVSVGVPLECLKRPSDRDRVLREALEFLK